MVRAITWCTPAQAASSVLSVGMWGTSGPLVLTGWLRGARSIDGQRSTGAQSYSGDLYMLEKVNDFLDETFGKSLKVKEYFPDAEKMY